MPARNDFPPVLLDAYRLDAFDYRSSSGRRLLRACIEAAWTSADSPAARVDPYDWYEMFTIAGFVTDCRRIRRPRRSHRLYRGCKIGGEMGMSWTDDLTVARRFAVMIGSRCSDDYHVVAAEVSADLVLGRFVHGRGEAEWVLNPCRIDEEIEWKVTR